jgi:trk system potassium uptake protein TrkA
MAQVAVIGLGRFGFHAATLLTEAGHEVLAIDVERDLVQRIRDDSSQAVVLDARDTGALRDLGIPEFDAVVLSLGEQVDTSALVTLHLKEIGVRRLIVKATSADHARLLRLIGADEVVFPERDAAERLAHRLTDANLLDFIPLGDSHSIRELVAASDLVGKSLAELKLRNRYGVQVIAIRHAATDALTVNPDPDIKVRESDTLLVLGTNEDLDRLAGG